MGFDDIEVIYLFKPQETDDEKEQSEEKNHLSSRAVSYTHLDVYKRQAEKSVEVEKFE